MSDFALALQQLLSQTTGDVYVQCPCQVTGVNGNFVDVLMFYNDEITDYVIYNVPIKRAETGRAYVFLGVKKGDYGTLRFYDRSIEAFTQGNFEYNGDDRQHDLNDRCFELGFIPSPEAFVYPENVDIEIGLKDNSAKISFAEGKITIIAQEANITAEKASIEAGELTLGSNTTIDGKTFLSHTHTSGKEGSPTGGVL